MLAQEGSEMSVIVQMLCEERLLMFPCKYQRPKVGWLEHVADYSVSAIGQIIVAVPKTSELCTNVVCLDFLQIFPFPSILCRKRYPCNNLAVTFFHCQTSRKAYIAELFRSYRKAFQTMLSCIPPFIVDGGARCQEHGN